MCTFRLFVMKKIDNRKAEDGLRVTISSQKNKTFLANIQSVRLATLDLQGRPTEWLPNFACRRKKMKMKRKSAIN